MPALPPTQLGVKAPKRVQDVLLTIRLVESGGRYDVPPNKGGASGAYQYIASTWNGYGGYPHAYLAPAALQDERALADVTAILETWKGDVSMVPVIWYYPRAAREPALMDEVPLPWAGNRLTVREYQHRWLDVLAYLTGAPILYGDRAVLPELRFLSGIPPEVASPDDDAELTEIAFPVLGRSLVAPPMPCETESCPTGTDAVIYGQQLQPILAAVDGVVTAVDPGDPLSRGVHVTITDRDGRSFRYAGFNDDTPGTDDGAADPSLRLTSLARIGTAVHAGQIIGFMGDTDPMPTDVHRGLGDPVWPHLRLSIVAADGTPLDADRLVVAAQRRQACHVAIGPWSVPADRSVRDVRRKDIEVSAILNGGWTLHRDGTVTAVGRSALIVPPEDCVWAPAEPFGPGAEGNRAPAGWGEPFEIAARFWVAAAAASTAIGPAALIRHG